MKKKQCLVLKKSRFVFLQNAQILKSVTSSWTFLNNGSYTYAYFLRILGTIKMKFGQILVYWWQTFPTCFWFIVWDWKLVPDLFMILLKWQYTKIRLFLIANIWYFEMSLIHFFKKMKHWNCYTIGYRVLEPFSKKCDISF